MHVSIEHQALFIWKPTGSRGSGGVFDVFAVLAQVAQLAFGAPAVGRSRLRHGHVAR